jgi:hypothetical protein
MMAPTQESEIRQRRGSAACPVADVMPLNERPAAARESTTTVAVMERAPKRGRNGPRPRADLYDSSIRIVAHHHPRRIARQTAGRFRGNVRATLEDGLSGCLRGRQHRRVDVDDDLIALTGRAQVDVVVKRGLGTRRQPRTMRST